jgi:hypothetical protein
MLPMPATYILDQRLGIVAPRRKREFDDHTIPQKQPNGSNRETSNRCDAGLTLVTHHAAAAINRVRQIGPAACFAEIGTAGGRIEPAAVFGEPPAQAVHFRRERRVFSRTLFPIKVAVA